MCEKYDNNAPAYALAFASRYPISCRLQTNEKSLHVTSSYKKRHQPTKALFTDKTLLINHRCGAAKKKYLCTGSRTTKPMYFRKAELRQHVAPLYSFNQSFAGTVRPSGPLSTPSITISITDGRASPHVHGYTAESYSESLGAVSYRHHIINYIGLRVRTSGMYQIRYDETRRYVQRAAIVTGLIIKGNVKIQ